MLKLDNVNIGYGEKVVIRGLTDHFEAGKIHGILGRNGAGKTTLFNTIYGFKKPNSGIISFQNNKIDQSTISFLETSSYFYPMMTGMEYLRLIEDSREKIDQWNRAFSLPLDEYVVNYSTGMKKKIAYLGVMLQDRPIWILDEPFNGVDIESNEKLFHLISRSKNEQRTILISSHILSMLTRMCDAIHVLEDGKFTEVYQPDQFGNLEKTFESAFKQEIDDIFDH